MAEAVLVLGGGLAGLQLARRLLERRVAAVLVEARERPGGLCRTERRGIWAWDIGPHAFYSRDPAVMARYRELPLVFSEHARRVRIFHRDGGGAPREVSYPFENGLADLPLPERIECVWGYLTAPGRGNGEFRNLDDWMRRGLGPGISRLFMRPYNEKIWAAPLDQVSMALVKGKIEPEPAWKVVRNAFVKGTVGRAYQSRFLYPEGGAGAITDAVAAAAGPSVRLGWELARLERGPAGWTAVSATGERVEARRVVSTIPIPRLLAALGGELAARYAGRFRHNDTFIAAVCLKEGRAPRRLASCHWVFFAGPELFYRVTVSSALATGKPTTLVAEVTRKGEAAGLSPDAVLGRVVAGLVAAGLIAEEDVGHAECSLEPFTYPIPTVGMEEDRAALERALEAQGLRLLGRSGRWSYINTDGVFAAVDAFVERHGEELARA